MQEGFELYGIETSPHTVWGLVIHATNRSAFWACASWTGVLYKKIDPQLFHVQLDSIHHKNLRRTVFTYKRDLAAKLTRLI